MRVQKRQLVFRHDYIQLTGQQLKFQIYSRTPQMCLLDRASYLKHFGVCFIKIGQGSQKLRQFKDRNFNPFFGRAT